MEDGRIFLKSRRDASFNKDLSNEPNFDRIHLALSKCVLDLNFAPIKGSVYLIFFKKSNLLYPIVHTILIDDDEKN